ncbi:1467_t:CDS:2 [Dentiscutata heterogama]|uniref:1467_t:CDS:1 n=1 Tax=Dentiscutata heterogama TaxID=1316150 RepID=A0ACA9M2I5_9GLOM|nr:1467_t:CDS:2 [Dentiscutata heterogama]
MSLSVDEARRKKVVINTKKNDYLNLEVLAVNEKCLAQFRLRDIEFIILP